jgi:hypothetical protein
MISATSTGIFSMILMANIPQILVSLAYFFYNGLLTIPVEVAEMLKPARVVPELASPSPESHMLFDLEALDITPPRDNDDLSEQLTDSN